MIYATKINKCLLHLFPPLRRNLIERSLGWHVKHLAVLLCANVAVNEHGHWHQGKGALSVGDHLLHDGPQLIGNPLADDVSAHLVGHNVLVKFSLIHFTQTKEIMNREDEIRSHVMEAFVNGLFRCRSVMHVDLRACTSDIMPVTADDLWFLDEFHWCRYWVMPEAQVLVICVCTDTETGSSNPVSSE